MKYLIFMLLISCGRLPFKSKDPRRIKKIDSTFQKYINKYAYLYEIHTGNKPNLSTIGIGFMNSKQEKAFRPQKGNTTTLARCRNFKGSKYSEIVVNVEKWEDLSETTRKVLIFHELGHCHLNQDHRDQSIMSTYILEDYIFHKYEKELYEELFTLKPVNIYYYKDDINLKINDEVK